MSARSATSSQRPHVRNAISVCIVCRNEADKLGPCLASVRWADEVIVLDLSSTDESAEVARRHGARVVTHDPVPVVEWARNRVAEEASGEWIFALDPDERVTDGLAAELDRLRDRTDFDAVAIPVMNFDFGYPATHPLHRYDPKPRFYRRSAIGWPTFPNALPVIPTERLLELPRTDELVIVHERNRNIVEAVDRVMRYAPAQAQAMIDAGEIFTARRMLAVLSGKIYKQFVYGRAFRDGVPGVIRAGTLVAFHFYVWAAFWHQSGARRTPADDRLLRRLDRTLESLHRVARAVLLTLLRARRSLSRLR